MKSLIAANPNKRTELKKEVVSMRNHMEILEAKCKQWDMYPGKQEVKEEKRTTGRKVPTTGIGSQAGTSPADPERRNTGTQVTEEDIQSETKTKEEVTRILEKSTLDEIRSILDAVISSSTREEIIGQGMKKDQLHFTRTSQEEKCHKNYDQQERSGNRDG